MKRLLVVLLVVGALGGGGVALAMTPVDARQVTPASDLQGVQIQRIGLVVVVRMTEAELTAIARREAQREGYSEVSNLSLACEAGEIVASARYAAAGLDFPILGHLVPSVSNGKIAVKITATQVGRLPLPIDMTQYLQGAMDQALGSTGIGASIRVRKVTVEPGALLIEAEPAVRLG